jgi:hypothetical protein
MPKNLLEIMRRAAEKTKRTKLKDGQNCQWQGQRSAMPANVTIVPHGAFVFTSYVEVAL